jgi:[protein-PII] uridylyltransferase
MDARFRTRDDGIVLDIFHVCSDRTGDPVPEGKWAEVNRDLVAALADNRDIRVDLRQRVETYEAHRPESGEVRVKTAVSGRFAVIEIRTPDRLGLLADIAEALHGEGLDVHLARIDTMGGEARDTFYVRRVGGAPIRDEAELIGLRGRLEDRLRG